MAASMQSDTGIVQDMREQDEQKHKMRNACAPPLLNPTLPTPSAESLALANTA